MNNTAQELIEAMQMLENPEQRKVLMGFFKTGKGQYGEGDECYAEHHFDRCPLCGVRLDKDGKCYKCGYQKK